MKTIFFLTFFIIGMIVSEHFLPTPDFEGLAENIFWVICTVVAYNLSNFLFKET